MCLTVRGSDAGKKMPFSLFAVQNNVHNVRSYAFPVFPRILNQSICTSVLSSILFFYEYA